MQQGRNPQQHQLVSLLSQKDQIVSSIKSSILGQKVSAFPAGPAALSVSPLTRIEPQLPVRSCFSDTSLPFRMCLENVFIRAALHAFIVFDAIIIGELPLTCVSLQHFSCIPNREPLQIKRLLRFVLSTDSVCSSLPFPSSFLAEYQGYLPR